MKVGLGYLHLNQALSTLSGGELQRVKLASYLDNKSKIFILDEPTDGLHVKDIHQIIHLFDSMVDQGNSIFLIEHNLDVLKAADYVIELGPGGGQMGGELLFYGTPAEMLSCEQSVTAEYLKKNCLTRYSLKQMRFKDHCHFIPLHSVLLIANISENEIGHSIAFINVSKAILKLRGTGV